MEEIKKALWDDYKEADDVIETLEVGDDGYEKMIEEKDRIRNELIKVSQIEYETKIKREQIKSEDDREKIRNGITIGTFLVSTSVSIYAIAKTFKFDQAATITSTLGRNILNGVVPKMFKR